MGEPVSKFCEAVKYRQLNRVGVTGNGKRSINIYIYYKISVRIIWREYLPDIDYIIYLHNREKQPRMKSTD